MRGPMIWHPMPLAAGVVLLLLLGTNITVQALSLTPVFHYLCNETSGSTTVKVSFKQVTYDKCR